ncbi:MAG TPA: hypothetical protein VNC50_03005, partial [Planctomycetia bacterium]|nr:hypothetical protein [Planctomycetia bacterium]
VSLLALLGIDPAKTPELQRLNQYAVCQDLAELSATGAEFHLPVVTPGLPASVAGPLFRSSYFFDAAAEGVPEPKDAVALDTFVEHALHSATSGIGGELDRLADSACSYHGLGWFGLASPTDKVLRAAAADLTVSVIERWRQPLDEPSVMAIRKRVHEFLEKQPLTPSDISDLVQKEAAKAAATPPPAIANRIIEGLLKTGSKVKDPQQIASMVRDTRAELRRAFGPDPVDDDDVFAEEAEVVRLYREAADAAAEKLLGPFRQLLEKVAETEQGKLETAGIWWTELSQAVAKMHVKLRELPRTAEIERSAYEAAYALHARLVCGGTLKQFVGDLETYVREKISFRHRAGISQAYLALSAKLESCADTVSAGPKMLEAVTLRCRRDREEAADLELGGCQQAIFLSGAVAVDDAAAEVKHRAGEGGVDALEARIREKVFAPRGGLWTACTDPYMEAEELAAEMNYAAADWLQQFQPSPDAAVAFGDRHALDPANAEFELSSFYDWAAPSVSGEGENPVCRCLAFVP